MNAWKGIAWGMLVAGSVSARAGFDVTGISPTNWAAADAALGFAAPPLLETFEHTQLVPGLTVEWVAALGTVGPVSQLPQLFRPGYDDPYGAAFGTAVWDGYSTAISGMGNKSWSYSDSGHWGDIAFAYAPGAAAIGFSVQQMDLDAGLVVNGVPLGKLAALAGGGTQASGGRNGYFVIRGTGGDRVHSIKLDNVGGDGFAIDHLAIAGGAQTLYAPTCFPPSAWFAHNSDLGIPGAEHEDFEDAALAPGLTLRWETASGAYGPTSTLPNVFDPASDSFGDAFDQGAWGGRRMVVNTKDNLSHPYNDYDQWGDVEISLPTPSRSVGFAISDLSRPMTVFVNGDKIGSTPNLACLQQLSSDGYRNGFLRIDAVGGTLIQTVRLANGRRIPYNDGWSIDHLVWLPDEPRLGGFATYEDFGGLRNEHRLTVEVLDRTTGVVLESHEVEPDALGNWGVRTSLTSGEYDVAVKADHWLRKLIGPVAFGALGATVDHVLVNGDVDGDNAVTVFDYNLLSEAFDSAEGNGNWNADADLDGDGAVTVFDYNILSANFDLSGD